MDPSGSSSEARKDLCVWGQVGLLLKLPLTCLSPGSVPLVVKLVSGRAAMASLLAQGKPFPNQIYGLFFNTTGMPAAPLSHELRRDNRATSLSLKRNCVFLNSSFLKVNKAV